MKGVLPFGGARIAGMKGVHQHGEKHLYRYLVEFDFRDSNRSALGLWIRNPLNAHGWG
jgi:hypothetical protein